MTVELRPATAADLEETHQVNRLVEHHDAIPLVTLSKSCSTGSTTLIWILAHDTRAAMVDGAIVGFARGWHRRSGERDERALVIGGVAPEFRRRGVGTMLKQWLLARADEILRAVPNQLPR